MAKEPKSEIAVPLRIVLVAPPPGVDFGIQEGKGNSIVVGSVESKFPWKELLGK